jgi:hypothetical protein
MKNTDPKNAEFRVGDSVDVDGIPMVVGYVGEQVALATEDGRGVAWGRSCQSEDFDDREEIVCVDLLSGAQYWACFYCRGIVPQASRA